MENKLIKYTSFLMLILVWSLFFFTSFKDLILLGFLLFLSGIIFTTKKENNLLFLVFFIFFIINIFTEIKENENMINNSIFLFINFLSSFILFFIAGRLFKNLFKNKQKFLKLSVIWIFTFIVSQFSVTFIDKNFISENNYIVGISFFSFYFISGYYISKKIVEKFFDIVLFNILPLIIMPLILLTSKKTYDAFIFDIGIILFSFLGVLVEHLISKKKIFC